MVGHELKTRRASATNPLDIVLGQLVKPVVAITANDQGEEVRDRIIVVRICQGELALVFRVRDVGERRRNV